MSEVTTTETEQLLMVHLSETVRLFFELRNNAVAKKQERESQLPITVDAFDYIQNLLVAAAECPNKQMRQFHIASARRVWNDLQSKTAFYKEYLEKVEKVLLEERESLQ